MNAINLKIKIDKRFCKQQIKKMKVDKDCIRNLYWFKLQMILHLISVIQPLND